LVHSDLFYNFLKSSWKIGNENDVHGAPTLCSLHPIYIPWTMKFDLPKYVITVKGAFKKKIVKYGKVARKNGKTHRITL